MLLTANNQEVFKNKTRQEINHIVSGHCHSDHCAEKAQAHALHDLKEVFPLKHKGIHGFSLQERARLI